jgi:carboxypeptidase C (cathepsin A)
MATTTITGRVFFAIGAYLATSIVSVFDKEKLPSNTQQLLGKESSGNIHLKQREGKGVASVHKIAIDIEGSSDFVTLSNSTETTSTSNTSNDNVNDIEKFYTAAALQDRIVDLPGLSYNPGFNQFSGYIDASPTRHIFYWYVESQSNPSKDPVVLWTK